MFQKDSKKWVEALLQGIQERKKEIQGKEGKNGKKEKERKGFVGVFHSDRRFKRFIPLSESQISISIQFVPS
jgi:hypothetical protein